MRAYFLQEYDWFTFFQKDYFLDDMVGGSDVFCSSLLVNAVPAVGCVSYRPGFVLLLLTISSNVEIISPSLPSFGIHIAWATSFWKKLEDFGYWKPLIVQV